MLVKWEAEIVAVLTLVGGAMHYTKIATRIPKKGTRNKPTAGVISAALYRSMLRGDSQIQRVGRGLYTLRDRRQAPRKKADSRPHASL